MVLALPTPVTTGSALIFALALVKLHQGWRRVKILWTPGKVTPVF
jgi:hypothetical protein